MILLGPNNTTTYIPNLPPPRVKFEAYFVALDVLDMAQMRKLSEERRVEFLRSHPRYQDFCPCGHRQFAHDEKGEGRCGAKHCPCPTFGARSVS